MFFQNSWMPGTWRVQSMKSMAMRYSSRVWPSRLGRQTCSWCRWFWQSAARTPCATCGMQRHGTVSEG